MARPHGAWGLLLLGSLCLVTCRGLDRTEIGGDGGPTREAGSRPPQVDLARTRTDMALHPSASVSPGRNVLWCATTQLAWDAMAVEIGKIAGKGPELRLGPPAPVGLVAAMNRHEFPHDDLDAKSCVVEGGFVGSGVVARFLERVKAMGQTFPLDLSRLDPEGVAALAYLFKDLPFAQPFLVHETSMGFDGGPRRVATFGLDANGSGAAEGRMLGQTLLHEGRPAEGASTGRGEELALELLPTDDSDRIVLGMIAPPSTLEEGWRRVDALRAAPGGIVPGGTELRIPKVDFSAVHRFREIEGARVLDAPPMDPPTAIVDFRQLVEFTLSEKGARLVAAVVMATNACASAPAPRPRPIVFDRPFLLAMVRKGATRPYFLAWFGNDALFVRRAP